MNIEENQQALVPAEGNLGTLRLKHKIKSKTNQDTDGFRNPISDATGSYKCQRKQMKIKEMTGL